MPLIKSNIEELLIESSLSNLTPKFLIHKNHMRFHLLMAISIYRHIIYVFYSM